MDVEEIQDRKISLEKDLTAAIHNSLAEFEKDTGFTVTDIKVNFERTEEIRGDTRQEVVFTGVETEVKL